MHRPHLSYRHQPLSLGKQTAVADKLTAVCLPPGQRKSKIRWRRRGKNKPNKSKERRKTDMTNSGDAAEQIVRISLEGVDYSLDFCFFSCVIFRAMPERDRALPFEEISQLRSRVLRFISFTLAPCPRA
jgi:hypothetical protein